MKINKRKQRGATLVSWLIVASLGVVAASAVVKVAPYYIEFNSVKGMMRVIASSQGIKKANMRQINQKIEKHLTVNSLYALESAYYSSRQGTPAKYKTKNPFTLKKDKKTNRRILTVAYDVPQSWIGNLFFLMKFKDAVVLGEPDVVIDTKIDKSEGERKRSKLNLR
jgi:Tfp pilus assembly major pilin PilA